MVIKLEPDADRPESDSGDSMETVKPAWPKQAPNRSSIRHNSYRSQDMLPDNIGEPAEFRLLGEPAGFDTAGFDTAGDEDSQIMFKNSGKPKSKPQNDQSDQEDEVRSFQYKEQKSCPAENVHVELVDEDEEVESRLSRLRSRKSAILAMGINEAS
jgi:hypothetical protein